jgi:quercetin dioxygenase-like cupin family protein
MMRLIALVLAVACSQPAKPVPGPGPTPVGPVPADAPGPSDEEKLAAIQKAMNELDEASQTCWAVAATERFDIEGELVARIEIEAAGAKAMIVSDATKSRKLSECVVALLGAYRWAPPLHGQTIQLPFKFRAPDGQSVIDRTLVGWNGQDKLSIAVLLDEHNTGNAAASMLEVRLAQGGRTGVRIAERAELWYFATQATIAVSQFSVTEKVGPHQGPRGHAGGAGMRADAGDMMYVAKGVVRDVVADAGEVRAIVVLFPGGPEGTARAGALPTPEYKTGPKAPPTPKILRAKDAKAHGPATIFVEPAIVKDAPFSASVLALGATAKVPEHVHAGETELLYVLEGSGTMTIAGTDVAITPTSVVQIPPNTKHAFAASAAVRAVQLYTPAGPEQRFKAPPKP